jgi:TetR/AcrR family transcriptional repressor of nem operon
MSAQNLKQHILDQGVALIMKQGYHGTGIQAILQAVNIPKGSFYNYFASKEEFGSQVIEHYIEPFILQLNTYLAQPEVAALTAIRSYFMAQIHELERKKYEGGCLLGNLMGEIGDTSEIARLALKQAVDRYRDTLAKGLARAQREGQVRTDREATEMADLLINAWQGALLRMKIERSVGPLRQFVDEILLGQCRA